MDPLPDYLPEGGPAPEPSRLIDPPSWTERSDAPLSFIDASGYRVAGKVDGIRARVLLRGFFGIARDVVVVGDSVTIGHFELEPPPGGRYTEPPAEGDPGQPPDVSFPGFAKLRIEAGGIVGRPVSDCGRGTFTDIAGNVVERGGVALRFDGIRLTATGMAFPDSGLVFTGGAVGPDTPSGAVSAAIAYENMVVMPGWSLDPGSGSLAAGTADLPGIGRVAVSSAVIERIGPGVFMLRASVSGDAKLAGQGSVPLASFAMRTGGELSGVISRGFLEFGSAPGWVLDFRLTGFRNGAAEGEGHLVLPEAFGGAELELPAGTVSTNSLRSGVFYASSVEGPVSLAIMGWDAQARGLSVELGPDGFAALESRSAFVEFGSMGFPVGTVSGNTATDLSFPDSVFEPESETGLPLYEGKSRLLSMKAEQGIIEARVAVNLPAWLGGENLEFDRVKFRPDHSFECEAIPEGLVVGTSTATFTFGALRLGMDGILAAGMSAELRSTVSTGTVRAGETSIRLDGSIDVAAFEPFEFAEAVVFPSRILFRDDSVRFLGEIELPSHLPESVAGTRMELSRLRFPGDGGVPEFRTRRETGPFLLRSGDAPLSAATMTAFLDEGRIGISFNGCSFAVMPDSPAAAAVFDGIRTSADGSLSWDSARLRSALSFELGGAIFRLDGIVELSGNRIVLSGIAAVLDPSSVKGTIRDFDVTEFAFSATDGSMLGASGIIRGVTVDLLELFGE
ncbi:MAG: hypothetical protein NT080_01250 [Spirochaetes bacterium]|nr:hypothetical protein [Spirochaetota bacterium]